MDLKNLNPKYKNVILAICIILLGFLGVFIGGYAACKEGNGQLMQDFSCVNTERLDLCRTPEGLVYQYNDKTPPLVLNLSNIEG